MMGFLASKQVLLDYFLISLGVAYAQQIALRAGVFSIATAGFVALGAYSSGYLVTAAGWPGPVAVVVAILFAMAVGGLLAIPLARLRGVFQAIATLAFVEIVMNALYYFEPVTGGAMGMGGIPKLVQTWHLFAAVAVTIYLVHSIGISHVGRAFDALRQDETVAASLGVPIRRYQTLALVVSAGLAGLFGSMQSLYFFTISPNQFGFGYVVAILTAVVLGGRATLLGPVVGVLILAILPEIARPLADLRLLMNGVILIAVIILLPNGAGDTLAFAIRRRRQRKAAAKPEGTADGNA